MVVVEFDFAGSVQSWVVPPLVTSVQLEAYGANSYPNSGAHKNGGYAKGTLAVTPGETLYIYVGGEGSGPDGGAGIPNGGWNGGGNGGYNLGYAGNGGGGASDVRQGGTALSNRKIVAGGAGATGTGSSSGYGGQGGAATGETGGAGGGGGGGGGGTQSAGGGGGSTAGGTAGSAGALGQGGQGGSSSVFFGGGGGGGYYGGGGGGGTTSAYGGGGGGGSNYVGGVTSSTSTQGVAHSYGTAHGQVLISYNAPPNQPTLTGPVNNSSQDAGQPITFLWVFNDPDSTDTQGSADFRWRVGTGAWTTVGGAASTTASYAAASGTWTSFVNQSVEWQVQTYDAGGLPSGWSASSYFTPRSAPSAPTLTAPATPFTTNRPAYTVAAGTAFKYAQIRMVNDVAGSPGSTVLADTGKITYSSNQTSVTGTEPSATYANGSSYHMQARVALYDGVWSAWASSGALVASIGSPPPTPTLTTTPSPNTASITVQITNPAGSPAVAYNDVYRQNLTDGTPETRIATGVLPNGSVIDWQAALNAVLAYRVIAYAATGTSTSST